MKRVKGSTTTPTRYRDLKQGDVFSWTVDEEGEDTTDLAIKTDEESHVWLTGDEAGLLYAFSRPGALVTIHPDVEVRG